VRVLVAEDDEGLGEVLARGLREQGYVVDLVPDGEAAAAYLRFYQYEVAVLDWRMPRLSGLDLVQRLRTTESSSFTLRDTPVFTCISATVERALGALDGDAQTSGIDPLITTPIT